MLLIPIKKKISPGNMGPPSMVPLPNAGNFQPNQPKKKKKKSKKNKLMQSAPQAIPISEGEVKYG